ncbi:UNVERIFIED_CONTAM: hypothetical protein Sradi_5217700 [Sesamum radiatum]|uniref:Uncharacterized protein n=1 Tax=Sesamum radiatum TaxID=300843 RepID=A0AAW2LJW7_SESRA
MGTKWVQVIFGEFGSRSASFDHENALVKDHGPMEEEEANSGGSGARMSKNKATKGRTKPEQSFHAARDNHSDADMMLLVPLHSTVSDGERATSFQNQNLKYSLPNRSIKDLEAGSFTADENRTNIPLMFTVSGIRFMTPSRRGRPRKLSAQRTSSGRKRGPGITLIETGQGSTHERKKRCQLIDEDSSCDMAEAAPQPRHVP